MAKWVYCGDNKRIPAQSTPTVCLFRRRVGERIVGDIKICRLYYGLYDDKIYWAVIGGEDKVQPYAYLQLDGQDHYDEQFLHNLVKLGELPV